MCTRNKIKATVGNATECDVCDEFSEVSNVNHTACGKNRKKNIKYTQIYSTSISCFPCCFYYLTSKLFYLSVCNAGHYRTGESCVLCPGDAIKPTVGDAVNCSNTCDEMMTVANDNHTDCGMLDQDCRK